MPWLDATVTAPRLATLCPSCGQCFHVTATMLPDLASLLRSAVCRLKHGPRGSGLDGPCDAGCAKCAVEAILNELAVNARLGNGSD